MNKYNRALMSIIPFFGLINLLINYKFRYNYVLIIPFLITLSFILYISSLLGFSTSTNNLFMFIALVISGFIIHPFGLFISFLIQNEFLKTFIES